MTFNCGAALIEQLTLASHHIGINFVERAMSWADVLPQQFGGTYQD